MVFLVFLSSFSIVDVFYEKGNKSEILVVAMMCVIHLLSQTIIILYHHNTIA
jgi:hypothetical protein